jgi:hypothetical protein
MLNKETGWICIALCEIRIALCEIRIAQCEIRIALCEICIAQCEICIAQCEILPIIKLNKTLIPINIWSFVNLLLNSDIVICITRGREFRLFDCVLISVGMNAVLGCMALY